METGQDDFTKAEMNLKSCALSLRNPVKLHLLLLCSLLLGVPLTDQLVAQTPPVIVDLDSTELEAQAIRVLSTYCASCHGTVKQNGQVQLDALETIEGSQKIRTTMWVDGEETVFW